MSLFVHLVILLLHFIPDTREVKGYTRLVKKYVAGRRGLDQDRSGHVRPYGRRDLRNYHKSKLIIVQKYQKELRTKCLFLVFRLFILLLFHRPRKTGGHGYIDLSVFTD